MSRKRRGFDQKAETTRTRPNRWSLAPSIIASKYPTSLPHNLGKGQIETYITFIRLAEITELLNSDNAIEASLLNNPKLSEEEYREELALERDSLVQGIVKNHPNLRQSGADAANQKKTGVKCSDKIYIPQRDYPEINFIGQLIGPRGSTLKEMEAETGAKISIRGKGSHKDGKSRADYEDEDEELHAFITADSDDKVISAIRVVNKIIEAAATSGGENDLKKAQLKKLASINGTLRDEEEVCMNCGQTGHRRFECTEKRNVTNSIVCLICGGVGHMKSDCIHKNNPEYIQRTQKMDQEYMNFMAELGGGSGVAPGVSAQASELSSGLSTSGGHYGPGTVVGGSAAPWMSSSAPAPQQSQSQQQYDASAYQQYYEQYYKQQQQ